MDRLQKYYSVRHLMGTFDRLEWHSNSLLGKMIRWKTKDWSNHTGSIVVFKTFKNAGIFTLEALEDGPDVNRLSIRLNRFNGSVKWYPLKEKYHEYRKKLGEIGLSYEGLKYDKRSLVRNLLGRVKFNDRELFCSEYTATTGIKAGLPYDKNYLEGKVPTPGENMDGLNWWDKGITILDIN